MDGDLDVVNIFSALLLCTIKSYFDIWNSASRASLRKNIACSDSCDLCLDKEVVR